MIKLKINTERFFLKIAKIILNKHIGKSNYQGIFESFFSLSLNGMNIGGGGQTDTSGERNALVYIKSRLQNVQQLTIFDVGANIGLYTILLNDIFNENAKIFSFEPSKKTFNTLSVNTGTIKNRNIFNFGFGNVNTVLTLYSNKEESGLASIYERRLDHFNIKMNLSEEIEIRTIDTFCSENSISKINFLKIDVEGHELNVLNGASELIKNNKIDFIQFEFGGCNIDSRTYFQDFYYLLKEDFYIYRILKDGLYKIENYKEMYETFITTNFLAERKQIDGIN
ncbi:FkbM family methyltransferase [Flavobacterium sp.]|uniref:FkbM family methyltransferase n=1 Tax=Flavobacterium sp. TaxID=239 RepID=UPI002C8AB4D5|nr:FkbM family methyltransferase [Flavobacterium sp.]HSD07372.1 FkbM family methyltransferase [Flavobacterium sp.]